MHKYLFGLFYQQSHNNHLIILNQEKNRMQWSDEAMLQAMSAVYDKTLGISQKAKKFIHNSHSNQSLLYQLRVYMLKHFLLIFL